jgi:F0F1-type ATP synthase gamma subunit
MKMVSAAKLRAVQRLLPAARAFKVHIQCFLQHFCIVAVAQLFFLVFPPDPD